MRTLNASKHVQKKLCLNVKIQGFLWLKKRRARAVIGAFKPVHTVVSRCIPTKGIAIACDLCNGEPQCIESCPEEALELVTTDEEAEIRFNKALEKLPEATERLTNTVKNKDWKPMLADAEKRSMKVSEKLEALNKKASSKKQ